MHKNLFEGLSKNSCSMDLSDIKNNLLKQQIHLKITTVSAVAGLQLS